MENIEKRIAGEIAAAHGLNVAKLGLRFDKVVVRLLGDLRAFVERASVKQKAVLVTITAPIKLPGKTQQELETVIRDLLNNKHHAEDRQLTISQNKVRLRIVASSEKRSSEFIGLVHNPDRDPELLLDLAAKWLIERGK